MTFIYGYATFVDYVEDLVNEWLKILSAIVTVDLENDLFSVWVNGNLKTTGPDAILATLVDVDSESSASLDSLSAICLNL
jgi:hypothetical protein